jgi:hypothetical protein
MNGFVRPVDYIVPEPNCILFSTSNFGWNEKDKMKIINKLKM